MVLPSFVLELVQVLVGGVQYPLFYLYRLGFKERGAE